MKIKTRKRQNNARDRIFQKTEVDKIGDLMWTNDLVAVEKDTDFGVVRIHWRS